jgi:predicted O-methyltransferase YrrM
MFPNWFKNVSQFFEAYVPQEPLRVLQIGTYTGDATEWLLSNREIEFIHDVDTWEGSDEEQHHTLDFKSVEEVYDSRFKENSKVQKFKMTSDEFFANISNSSYNFIYIDGDHTAIQTALDGLNAFKLLELSGVIAFDDYGWGYGGKPFLEPKRGVDAFMAICEGEVKCISHGYQVWFERLL